MVVTCGFCVLPVVVGLGEYYEVRNAFVDFIPGIGWVLPLPFIKDEIELTYLE